MKFVLVCIMMHAKSYQKFMAGLEFKKLSRILPILSHSNKQISPLDFSSNDYLQLSKSKSIIKAGIASAKQYGFGSTGSRLLSGNHDLFQLFENEIAQAKQTERALLFNSGFQANLTVLSALLDEKNFEKQPLVFFDKLNHKSLYEAVKLSDAKLIRFAHNDMTHLEFLLKKHQHQDNPKFIVAETLYGMDGDVAECQMLAQLAKKYGALLYLDEAHATGIYGVKGYGLSTTIDFQDVEYVVMGTFSKALGGAGAYVACSETIYQYLINRCSGFIYSTAASPMMVGAMRKAWSLIPQYQAKVANMLALSQQLRKKLTELGFNTSDSTTHITPIIFENMTQALDVKQKLIKNNILVSFLQYPTVPKNQPRLRIALNVNHTTQDIDKLVNCL